MIERGHDLLITKQAEVLRISRGSIDYLRGRCRRPICYHVNLDRLSGVPFAGSRMLRGLLAAERRKIGRRQ